MSEVFRVTYSTSPLALLNTCWRYRDLIWQMTKRDVIGRYRGSVMGLLWSFFNPLLMLTVYTFVFSVVLKTRWGIGSDSQTEFALVLFAGMIVHGLFAECTNRAPSLILSNVNYVKKVVFPLETLPWVTLGSALFHTAVSFMVLMFFYLAVNWHLAWTVILFPLVIIPLIFLILGIAWFLASIGVFIRDIGHAIGLVTTIMLFLSPVFYPVSAIPQEYRAVISVNPLTFIIEQSRNVLIWGKMPDWAGLGLYLIGSLLVAWCGYLWFQNTRKGFADVL